MYQDAGYGENWLPEGNNARRFDPYTRSCVVLGSLFAIGFVLIVIIVLSLIPIYVSNKTATQNVNIQTSRVTMINYQLEFESSLANFYPQTVLSNTDNRQALQAALTSMLQKDSVTTGSVIEIDTSTFNSLDKRRQISNRFTIRCNLIITSNRSCSSAICSSQFLLRVNNTLSNPNQTTFPVRYRQTNSTENYWLYFRLPRIIQSAVSLVYVDPKTIASLLSTLMAIDNTPPQPSVENSTVALID